MPGKLAYSKTATAAGAISPRPHDRNRLPWRQRETRGTAPARRWLPHVNASRPQTKGPMYAPLRSAHLGHHRRFLGSGNMGHPRVGSNVRNFHPSKPKAGFHPNAPKPGASGTPGLAGDPLPLW